MNDTLPAALRDQAAVLDDIRDGVLGEAEARDYRRMVARPLPDAHDVRRFIETSRAAAVAHRTMLASGDKDWALGTPLESALFRTTNLREHVRSVSGPQQAAALCAGTHETVSDVLQEADYALTMIEDAIARLDPATDGGRIARLSCLTIGLCCAVAAMRAALETNDINVCTTISDAMKRIAAAANGSEAEQ